MSTLGDRLRALREKARAGGGTTTVTAFGMAANLADEHEAAALAESAQGRGPHAAAVLGWLADVLSEEGAPDHAKPAHLRVLADEAER